MSLGYGLALMVAICVSGGVSGGHLNPAVTLAMAAIKKLRWAQVVQSVQRGALLVLEPVYIAGQYLVLNTVGSKVHY